MISPRTPFSGGARDAIPPFVLRETEALFPRPFSSCEDMKRPF